MQDYPARQGLSIGDGFKFGCGFIIAAAVFNLLLFVLLAIVGLVISLLGVALTVPFMQ